MKIEDFDEKYNNHPLAQREEERYNLLSDEKKEKLRILDRQELKEYQLNVIKRKRIKPKKGDVFVVSPHNNMFFWGIVINSNISIPEGDDLLVVFILRDRANFPEANNVPKDITNLLIEPAIVERWYWNKGFFYNVGVDIEIPDNIDYGFYSIGMNKYVDEYKNILQREPQLVGMYGVCTDQGIAYEINRELIVSGLI